MKPPTTLSPLACAQISTLGGREYVYTTDPSVFSFSPTTGPERGNTTVLVTGATFDSASPDTDYVCRFGGASRAALVAPATRLNATVMMCASPAREAFLPQTVSPPRTDPEIRTAVSRNYT